MSDEKVERTMGYRKGEAREFALKPGEKLPEGWSNRPHPGDHPHDKDGTNPPVTERPQAAKQSAR